MTAQTTSLEKIIVLDFGSQYNQLITRRIREFGVFSELLHNDITAEEIKAHGNVKGIIFSGGPHSVYAEDAFTVDPAIFELGIPVLGICYGMQLTTHLFGGKVESSTTREYGSAKVDVFNTSSGIFKGLAEEEEVLMSHGDRITAIPEGFSVTASNAHTPFAAFENQERRITACNSTQKFAIVFTATTCFVTSCSIFLERQATGRWTALLKWKLRRFAKKWAIRKSYWVSQAG